MNVKDFYKYIEQPELLNASTVAELQELLKAYPYFQTAHVLYLKSLYNQNNFKFNYQLKFSSVHVNNRKKLLFYLKGKTPSLAYSTESTDEKSKSFHIESHESDPSKDALLDIDKEEVIDSSDLIEDLFEESKEEYLEEVSVSAEKSEGAVVENVSELEADTALVIDSKAIILNLEIKGESPIEEHINEDLLDFEPAEISKTDDDSKGLGNESEVLIEDLKPEVQIELSDDFEVKPTDNTLEKPEGENENNKEEAVNANELVGIEAKHESKLEEDVSIVTERPLATVVVAENLSPREILQRRINEIKKSKQEHSTETIKESKPDFEKGVVQSVVQEKEPAIDADVNEVQKHVLKAVLKDVNIQEDETILEQEEKEVLGESVSNTNINETDILGDELSDLIQIAAPAEYFLEDLSSEPGIKLETKFSKRRKKAKSESKQSFSYWVKHLQNKKDQQLVNKAKSKPEKKVKPSKEKPVSKLNEKSSLIDSFLADTKPKAIKPKQQVVNALKDKKNTKDETDEAFMTETLAQIYIKQAYYDKAIEAYVKLSLKYPKKNTYFATQIKKVKTLQLNS